MKKISSIIFLSIISLFILPSLFLVQGKQSQGTQGQGIQPATAISRGIETASESLNRVVNRNNNPEIGEQVRTMVQNHEQIQVRTKTALHQMDQRNQALKFMIGPDYKNAGQVRSDVVGLRNDINKLEQIKENSLPSDIGDVQGAIDELQVEADELEIQLTEKLSGFSLFGWLNRLINK